jgi:hypothetical protein
VLNKADAFLTDPMMRAVIGQGRSSFNFRWMMDNNKILLCNLSRGRIGDDNSMLLGSLVVMKEKLAALSREDIPEQERVPHALYIDEAANFIGDFESILSQTRKYAFPMSLAVQNTESLPSEAVSAIFTNCATIVSFRVSASDAECLAKEFGDAFLPSLLQEIPDYMMHVRTLKNPDRPKDGRRQIGGAAPSGPHYVATHPPFRPHPACAWRSGLIGVSHARYAKPRAVVQEELHRLFF